MRRIKNKKKYLIIIVSILFLLFFNKLLGESLGLIGNCKSLYDKENKVRIYTNCQGITKTLIDDLLGASAFTLDHVILTNQVTLNSRTYKHELAHTKQYSYFGPLFLPLYGIAYVVSLVDAQINNYQNPHAGNFFEIWANKMADLPLSAKIPK